MPYTNEHSCRLIMPINGAETKRVNNARNHEGKPYHVIYQKQKDGKWKEQAYRYSKDVWTASTAKSHCESHDGILFETAKEKIMSEDLIIKENNELLEDDKIEIREIESKLLKKDGIPVARIENHKINIGDEIKELPRGRVSYIFTDLSIDDFGEVIKPDGVILDRIKKNPIVLYCHNSFSGTRQSVPIGNIDVESLKITEKRITGDVLFDLWEEWGNLIFLKIIAGSLKGGSIGFKAIETSNEPIFPKQKGLTILKWLWYEFSIVPLGANANALQTEFKFIQDMLRESSENERNELAKNADTGFIRTWITNIADENLPLFENYLKKEREKRNYMKQTIPIDLDELFNETQWNIRMMLDILHEKEGKVISGANIAKLKNAYEAIGEVIASATEKPKEEIKKDIKPQKSFIITSLKNVKFKKTDNVNYLLTSFKQ